MTRPRSLARPIHCAIALPLAAFVLAACSASVSRPASPPIPLTDVDSALAELDRAENEIHLSIPAERQRTEVALPGAAAPNLTPAPEKSAGADAPSPPPSGEEARPGSGATAPPAVQASDSCVTACQALASMERAVTHLCSLTGEEDARCDGARSRVRSATERVRAGCPSCEA